MSGSATGAGGGAINVAAAEGKARLNVTISNTIEASAILFAGVSVNITTSGHAFAKSVASNDGGGFISVGTAGADTEVSIDNTIDVKAGTSLTGVTNVTVSSRSDLRPTVIASASQGGLAAGALMEGKAKADYTTETLMRGAVYAGNVATVEARSYVDAYAKITADVGGFGVAGNTDARALVGYGSDSHPTASALTHTSLESGALVEGRTVHLNAIVEKMSVVVDTKSRATAFGADSRSRGRAKVQGSNEVTLGHDTTVNGNVRTSILSEYQHVNVVANSTAICRCFGGATSPTAEAEDSTDARVVALGPGSAAALIRTADLTVAANQQIDGYLRNTSRSGGFLDFGGSSKEGNADMWRRIFWEARVIMLGEPNPWLEIDATGKITKITNVVFDAGGVTYDDDPTTPEQGLGETISGTTINVHDIIYDHGANARLLANGLPATLDGKGTPVGEIWGDLGVFEFQQTWDFVKLLNSSSLHMVTHIIDVVNTVNSPVIEIRVDKIWDDVDDGPYTLPLDPAVPGTTLDFDIEYTFPPTLVRIENLWPFGNASHPYIRLDGYIENPIGKTHVENLSGDILSSAGAEIIRTNILELSAPHGDIGHQSPTHADPDPERNPIAVEMVRYQHIQIEFCDGNPAPCYKDIVVKVDAGKDAVLDLTANRRTDEALGSFFGITIDHINAGDDVDVVLNDSKNGDDTATSVLVTINLYNPGDTLYHYVFPTGYTPAPVDAGPLTSPCPVDTSWQRQVQDPLPAGCRRCGPRPDPAGVRRHHDRCRVDLHVHRRPRRRRHRHLPRHDRRRGAQDLPDDRDQRRDPRRHRRHPGCQRPRRDQDRRRLERRRDRRPG